MLGLFQLTGNRSKFTMADKVWSWLRRASTPGLDAVVAIAINTPAALASRTSRNRPGRSGIVGAIFAKWRILA